MDLAVAAYVTFPGSFSRPGHDLFTTHTAYNWELLRRSLARAERAVRTRGLGSELLHPTSSTSLTSEMERRTRVDLFDRETTLANEVGDVTGYVAAFKYPTKEWFGSLLPTLHRKLRCESICRTA